MVRRSGPRPRPAPRLSTHLGNGIASELPRHPNPIWEQAASPVLLASFIADGHHLDPATLRVLARAKGPAQTILVSDASPLAGLPPGVYGEWAVDPSGKIVVAGTPYLAGSNQGLEVGLRNLLAAPGWTLEQAIADRHGNPARLLGRPVPRLAPGEPADLVIFRCPRPDRLRSRAGLRERSSGRSDRTSRRAESCRTENARGAGRRETTRPYQYSCDFDANGSSLKPFRPDPCRRPSRPRASGSSGR